MKGTENVIPGFNVVVGTIPVEREGVDHDQCRIDGNVYRDTYGFLCSRCTYKKGIPK